MGVATKDLVIELLRGRKMNGQTLYEQREEIKKSLHRSMDRMYSNGVDYAEKTRTYRTKLAETILVLKANGIQISILDKVAKGQEAVADAEFEMITAEVLYKASQENIMIQKKLLDSVEEEIRREWGRNT